MPGALLHPLVLLVDDDAASRESIASLLGERGMETVSASMEDAAIQVLWEQHPQALILIHLHPPYERGLSMICRIRRTHLEAKIIALSGGGLVLIPLLEPWTSLETAGRLGADRTLLQPLGHGELTAALHDLAGDLP